MNPLRALSESAPVLGLAALLVLPQLGRHESAAGAEVQARNAEVLTAIDAAPYRIGQWIGEDVAVPPAALEILQTNAILSRRFRHLTSGINANLLVVHCSDARDMQGHYPPVCYPANGWILPESGGRRSIACEGGGGPQDLTVYDFRRLDEFGTTRRLRVFNYFVLPDGTTSRDIDVVSRLVRRHARSIEGVAQVQVTFDGTVPLEDAQAAVNELLDGIEPLLQVLREGERIDDHV